jgi:hypothetical protein
MHYYSYLPAAHSQQFSLNYGEEKTVGSVACDDSFDVESYFLGI